MAGPGNLEAIKVQLGIDASALESELRNARNNIDRKLPQKRTVNVHIKVHADQRSVRDLYASVKNQFDAFSKQKTRAEAISIAPRMVVDPRVMRDFRRDIERNMRQSAQQGQSIHVPIRFNGDSRAFIQSVQQSLGSQHVIVDVKGRFTGWEGGEGPTGTGGARGGPSRPPTSGPTSGGTSGPARSAPSRPSARGAASGWTVADVDAFWAKQNAELDQVEKAQARHRDRYERRKVNEDKHAAAQARREYLRTHPGATPAGSAGPAPAGPGPTPVQGSTPPPPSGGPTRRQQRQTERRERMAGGRNTYGPGSRDTVGASRNPAYVEPEGGRVTVDNVRAGSVPPPLSNDEEVEYTRQVQGRGRVERPGDGPQPTGRRLSRNELRNNETLRRTLEQRAQRTRAEQAALRHASPEDAAAREILGRGFHPLDELPGGAELASMLDMFADPEYRGSFKDLLAGSESGRLAYVEMFHGRLDKSLRKQLGIIRGTKKGDINTVDPVLLSVMSALDAGRQYARVQANPLEVVKTGDNKRRGRGGKVGQVGGFNAGRLASESVDQAVVNEIMARRRIGGRGNGWKTLEGEFGRAEVNRAKALMREQAEAKPVTPVEPGKAYGGGAEMYREGEAPSIPGGQGMTRGGRKVEGGVALDAEGNVVRMPGKSQYDIDMEKLNDGTMTREEFNQRHGLGAPKPRGPRAGMLHDEVAGTSPAGDAGRSTGAPPAPDFGNAGRPRMSTPPRPESRAYGRNTGYRPGTGPGGAFWEFLKGFRASSPGAMRAAESGYAEYPERVRKLVAMAGQTEQSPHEAAIARELLRRRGIPGFAEGGIMGFAIGGVGVAGRLLRSEFKLRGDLPRVGSLSRRELEERYQKRITERERRARKPLHQQGGRSNLIHKANAEAQYAKDPFCAFCGKMTQKGDPGKLGFTADHLLDVGRGGDENDPENLVTACKSCNSYRSGGRKARPLGPGQRMALLPAWTQTDDPVGRHMHDEELDYFRTRRGFAEGGRMMATGLLQSKGIANVAMVGERGPELIVEGKNGQTEVIPHHKVQSWMSGKGYAPGGVAPQWRMRDTLGRPARASAARMTGGIIAGGDITRVFVVNWPPSASFTAAQQNPAMAGANASTQASAAAAEAQAAAAAAAASAAAAQQAAGGGGGAPGGPGAGGPAGAPAPGSGRFRRGVADPYDRVLAREISLRGELRTGSLESRIGVARAGISGSLQEVPVRALTVAFGQIAQQMIGGREGILARARAAQTAASRAQRAVGQFQALRQTGAETRFRIADIQAGRETFDTVADRDATLDQLRAQYTQNVSGRQRALQVARQRVSLAEEKEAGVLSRPQQFKAQAVGLGGILAGGLVFNAGVNAVAAGMQAIETAAKPLVQAMLGWPEAIERSTTAIRDSISSMRGQAEAATAAAVAPSGISARFLDRGAASVSQTGLARAAEVAAAQALDITRASRKGPQGLYEGVGGLFGTNVLTEMFGGQPGFLQDVTKRLNTNREPFDRGDLARRMGVSETRLDDLDREVVLDLNESLKSAAEYAGDAAKAFALVPEASTEMIDAMLESAKKVGPDAESRAREFARAGIAIAGPGGRALQGEDFGRYAEQQARGQLIQDPALLLRATQPQRDAQMWAMRQRSEFARTEDIPAQFALRLAANPLARLGTSFSTQGSQLAETEEGRKTLANLEKYSALTAKSTTNISALQKRGMDAAERTVARIDNPSLAGGIGLAGTVERGGRDEPRRRVAGAAVSAFRAGIGVVAERAQLTQTMRDDVMMRQSNLQAKEYANQLRIMERSLSNAQDMWAAINGSASNTIGGLQGQNLLLDRQNQLLSRRAQRLAFKSEDIGFAAAELQRQSQQLSFAMTQRQINFSVAQAGFTAPGQTAEERSARIEEAKLQAAYDQKQLDLQIRIAAAAQQQLKLAKEQSAIQRQIFANSSAMQDNQFAIATKQAKQDMEDIQKQLELMKEARAVEIDTKGVEEAIDRVRTELEPLNAEVASYVEQGNAVREAVIDDIARLRAETGKGFSALVNNVSSAWAQAATSYINDFIKPVYAAINSTYPTGGGNNDATYGPQAAGWIGTVNEPTRFIAGEAGSEHVIVLRGARSGMLTPTSGGGGGMVVNVGGVSVILQGSGSTEADAERLATLVTDRISRKLAMIGG